LRANLRNQVRQTSLPKWKPLLPLFEAAMNSFQAINEAGRQPGNITIEIEREPHLLPDAAAPITGFKVTDDGAGFHDINFDSFNTSFSELKLPKGGKGLVRAFVHSMHLYENPSSHSLDAKERNLSSLSKGERLSGSQCPLTPQYRTCAEKV
jgi:hypothetical protein